MAYLWKRGYYVQRAYASKGVFDITATAGKGGLSRPLLIQAKGDEKYGYINPEESARLKIATQKYNGYCCIAFKIKHKLRWRLIDPYAKNQNQWKHLYKGQL